MKTAKIKKFKVVPMILIGGVVFSAGMAAGKMDFFRVKYLILTGNTELNSNDILELSGISLGDCIFFVDTRSAENRLARRVFAEDIRMKKQGFNALRVEIIERRPSLSIGEGRGVDADGYILPMDSALVCLKAKTFFEYRQTDRELRDEDKVLKEIAEICSHDVDFSLLREVVVEKEGLSVKTEDGIYVFIGNSDLLSCYKILLTLHETKWWNSEYCYDLSSPGELLISKKSVFGNNKDRYGG